MMGEHARMAGNLTPLTQLAVIQVLADMKNHLNVFKYDAKYDGLLTIVTDNANGKSLTGLNTWYCYNILVSIENYNFRSSAAQMIENGPVTTAMMTLPLTAGQRATLSYDAVGFLQTPFNILVYHSTFQ
jgi:hypothetical protein